MALKTCPSCNTPLPSNPSPSTPPLTGLVTTPLDVLKTRLMVQGASGRYKNLFDATYQVG